jgi:hypothetical protein
VDAIERGLMSDGFVLRYRTASTDDGLPARRWHSSPALLACATLLSSRPALTMLSSSSSGSWALCNDVGLLAEEYDGSEDDSSEIFRSFSHISLINTAHNLSRAENPVRSARSTSEHER